MTGTRTQWLILRLRSGLIYLVVIGVVVVILNTVPRDFRMTFDQTRPFAWLLLLTLGGTALWGALSGLRAFVRNPRAAAWRMSLRMVGFVGLAAALGLLVMGLQEPGKALALPFSGLAQAVEGVIPLVMAVQAALIFSPDDEPALEVLLACPRSPAWLLLERMGALLVVYGALALLTAGISLILHPQQPVVLALTRWLPAALLLSGLAAAVTLRSRTGVFGAAAAGLIWFIFGFFGAAFMPGAPLLWPLSLIQPFVWPINPYFTPQMAPTSGDYILNRIIAAALGLVLLLLCGCWLRNEEQMLLGGRKPGQQPDNQGQKMGS